MRFGYYSVEDFCCITVSIPVHTLNLSLWSAGYLMSIYNAEWSLAYRVTYQPYKSMRCRIAGEACAR